MHALQLGGLAAHLFFDFGLNARHLGGHAVERARQIAQLVIRARGQPIIQVSTGHAMRAVDQHLDRPVHHHPDERHGRQRTKQHRPHQEPRQGGLVLRDLGVHGGEGKIGVDHPQHKLVRGVDVAGRVRTRWRVIDGANHRQQVRALLIPEHAGPVGAVELGERRRLRMAPVAGLGALVHHRVDFARVGGKSDAAILIKDADALDARLAAQLADDVVQRLAVVVQHFVPRAAQDHVGDAVGGLLHEIPRMNALRPQVDEAE